MSVTDFLSLLFWGYIFYMIYKRFSKSNKEHTYSQRTFRNFTVTKESLANSDLGLFVALTAKVAKADGRVDALEAQLVGMMFDDISAVFPDPYKAREILKEIFREEKNRTDDTQAIAQRLGRSIRGDRQKQQQFMGFLIQLAFADGEVSRAENAALHTIAQALNIDPHVYNAIFDQFDAMIKNVHPQSNIKDAYKLLGVNESDDMNTIKKAYRKKVREFHPDIIKSQNKGEAYMEEATKKTQELNKAYDMIKKVRR